MGRSSLAESMLVVFVGNSHLVEVLGRILPGEGRLLVVLPVVAGIVALVLLVPLRLILQVVLVSLAEPVGEFALQVLVDLA